ELPGRFGHNPSLTAEPRVVRATIDPIGSEEICPPGDRTSGIGSGELRAVHCRSQQRRGFLADGSQSLIPSFDQFLRACSGEIRGLREASLPEGLLLGGTFSTSESQRHRETSLGRLYFAVISVQFGDLSLHPVGWISLGTARGDDGEEVEVFQPLGNGFGQ